MNKTFDWFFKPPVDGTAAIILLRLMAGSVFLWEGLMKFVFPNQGVGRFTKLGFPAPHFMATADAWLEIIGGTLLILGLLTRPLALLFIIEMLVAMASTKIPLYLGTSPLPLPPVPPQVGFWAVLHEVRSEYAQMLTVMFLLVNGPGKWSLDAVLRKWRKASVSELVPSGSPLACGRPALLRGVLLTGCLRARQNPEPNHYDGAHHNPVCGHVKQVRPINQASDHDRESNRVKSERHSIPLRSTPQLR